MTFDTIFHRQKMKWHLHVWGKIVAYLLPPPPPRFSPLRVRFSKYIDLSSQGRENTGDKFPSLRPAGSDPRVGDGLVWNPIPMAFKYTFLDRMQRS